MSKRLIWSYRAKKDLLEIKAFYDDRNQSTQYSDKLLRTIRRIALFIQKYPYASRATDKGNVRGVVVLGYIVFFEILDKQVLVLTVWDSRRDPEQLRELI